MQYKSTVGTHPLYWRDDGADGWSVFTLGGRRPLDPNEPVVHVSHYEADAYANWRGVRLPTEFEWEHAVCSLPPGMVAEVDDVAWQWTGSAYLAYPRFKPAPGGRRIQRQVHERADDAARRRVTSPGHTRVTYRNFFPPASRWMFGGVRLAKDVV